jgi:ketosteroid isomerase-like protein
MPSQSTLDSFIALVLGGKHDEAIERFYTPDATMQENLDPPRKGRDNLVARERATMAYFKTIHSDLRQPVFADGDHVVINWVFRFEAQDGSGFTHDEIAWQRWEGEKIAEERFYYDPAQRNK